MKAARNSHASGCRTPQNLRSGRAVLYTVGHSTHPIERFLELLGEHRIAILADVRSFPGSRRWPQFNQEPLAEALGRAGVEYRWLKGPGRTAPRQACRFAARGMDGRRFSLLRGLHRER